MQLSSIIIIIIIIIVVIIIFFFHIFIIYHSYCHLLVRILQSPPVLLSVCRRSWIVPVVSACLDKKMSCDDDDDDDVLNLYCTLFSYNEIQPLDLLLFYNNIATTLHLIIVQYSASHHQQ